jgi:hypothetical protein
MRGAWKPAAHCAVAAVALASPPCSLSLSLSLCSLISQSSRALALALRIAALSRGGSGSAAPARANHAHGHVAGSGGARQVAGARNAAIGPVAAVAHLPRARPRGPRRLRPAVGWSWWSFTQVRGGLRPFATGRYAMARAVRYTGVAPSAADVRVRGRIEARTRNEERGKRSTSARALIPHSLRLLEHRLYPRPRPLCELWARHSPRHYPRCCPRHFPRHFPRRCPRHFPRRCPRRCPLVAPLRLAHTEPRAGEALPLPCEAGPSRCRHHHRSGGRPSPSSAPPVCPS